VVPAHENEPVIGRRRPEMGERGMARVKTHSLDGNAGSQGGLRSQAGLFYRSIGARP
jgi:hypothetical protein